MRREEGGRRKEEGGGGMKRREGEGKMSEGRRSEETKLSPSAAPPDVDETI